MTPRPGETRDELTRSTRLAANAGGIAVVAHGVLYLVTTQIPIVRQASPFGDDPWDVVVSFGAIFLAIVVAATGVRSLGHRGPRLEPATASRIQTGVGMALVTIGLTLGSDASALVLVPLPDPAATIDGRLGLIVGLVVASGVTAIAAAGLLIRARSIAAVGPAPTTSASPEPDVIDDLLRLVRDGAAVIPPIRSVVDRGASGVDRFLATSPASPRRHRLAFGLVAATAAGLGYDVWHAAIEGAWGSLVAVVLFAVLVGGGVLAVYLATLGPLRLIRSVGRG